MAWHGMLWHGWLLYRTIFRALSKSGRNSARVRKLRLWRVRDSWTFEACTIGYNTCTSTHTIVLYILIRPISLEKSRVGVEAGSVRRSTDRQIVSKLIEFVCPSSIDSRHHSIRQRKRRARCNIIQYPIIKTMDHGHPLPHIKYSTTFWLIPATETHFPILLANTIYTIYWNRR